MKKLKLLKKELIELYINQKLSTKKISKIAERHPSTIVQWVKDFNIPLQETRNGKFKITDEEMIRLYVEKEMSLSQISKIAGCSLETIRRKLLKQHIERRGFSNYNLNISKEEIKRLYLKETLNTVEIAKIAGCRPCTILYHMDNMGINRRNSGDVRYNLNVPKEEIGRLYVSGKNTYEIAKIAGCTPENIGVHLRNLNVEIRSNSETSRKYKINENFFDKIDTQEKAYILGLLYADGCSFKNNIEIALTEKDVNLLIQIRNLIYPNKDRPIYHKITKHNNGADMKHLTISNKHIATTLREKWGLIPQKSLILTYPTFLNKCLERHFIRGYFDGDGSIWGNKNNKYKITFGLIGTENFIKGCKNTLENTLNLSNNKIQVRNSINDLYLIQYGGKQLIEIYNYFYQNKTIYLQRKYDKFTKLLKSRNWL